MADTATMGAALVRDTTGPIRETAHRGRVLLYGSGSGNGDGNSNPDGAANPTGFKGIIGNSGGVSMTENTVKMRLHMRYNPGHGARNENDTLPSPGSDTYSTLAEPLRANYSLFSLTGQLIAAAERGEADFKPAFQESVERTVTAAKGSLNRQAFGNGTGVLTAVRTAAIAGATVIDVDTTIYFRGGEIVDMVTIATGAVTSPGLEVIAVNRAARQITVSPGLTGAAAVTTDGLVLASPNSTIAAPNNSWNRETQGLRSIVASTGTLHGITPAVFPQWVSFQQGAVGAISDSVLRNAKDSVGFETGLDEDGMEFAIITTRGIRSAYADTQMPLKRHVNTQKLEGGFDVIMFDGNPIFVDDHCQPETVYGLRLPKLEWKMLKDWSWMDEDGAVLSRVTGKDQYVAVLYQYGNLVTTHRGAHFVLQGVTDTVR